VDRHDAQGVHILRDHHRFGKTDLVLIPPADEGRQITGIILGEFKCQVLEALEVGIGFTVEQENRGELFAELINGQLREIGQVRGESFGK
jgi:hypothetical protein